MGTSPGRRWLPGTAGTVLAVLAVGIVGLMALVGLLMALDPEVAGLGASGAAIGLFGLPLGALLLLIGAVVERDPPPRMALAWAAEALLVAGWVVTLVACSLDPEAGFDTAAGLTFFMVPLMVGVAVPGVLFTRRAQETLAREARADRFAAAMAAVSLRGKVGISELAGDLGVDTAALKEELAEAVRDRQFSGYVNWKEGVLYGRDARALTEHGRCPSCGGAMELAGHKVITCQNCEAEVFL